MKKIVRQAFVATLPVLTGYLVLGLGFGIILKVNGYGVFLAFVMSLIVYAGSMQYVAIGLITAGASLITVALTTLTVNARHLFYGISLLDKYKNTGKRKPYLIFALTDETYSLVCNDDLNLSTKERNNYYFFVSLFNHMYWVTGSVLGAFMGSIVKFNSEGIDFALTALFLTVFIEQWISTKKHFPAIIGVVVSVICLIIFGKENFLIPPMLGISIVLCQYKGEQSND